MDGDANDHSSASFRFEAITGKFARVLPMGDSITVGMQGTHAGYRGPLAERLAAEGIAYQFVGAQSDNQGDLPPDQVHHEGHSGFLIAARDGNAPGLTDQVDSWLGPTGVTPDIILLMIGTNDVDQGLDLANAGSRLDALISKLVDKTAGLHPGARCIVAQIPPINDPAEDQLASEYNARVASVVARHKAAGNSVSLVDMHSALGLSDLADKLHPNDTGYAKMANIWFKAITTSQPRSHW
jgi:lysophospholipase L1-like esterase